MIEVPFPVVVLGLISGLSYGLLGVGLVLVYRASRVINFAHGETGAFAAAVLGVLAVTAGVPYWLVFPLALVVGAAASCLVEVVAVRRLRKAPAAMSIIATLGLATFLLFFGLAVNTQVRRGSEYPQPPGFPSFEVGALTVTPSYTAILLTTPLLVGGLALFLKRSRYGIAIRAAAENRDAAVLAGISASRMSLLAWGLAGAVSAYTAVLQFPAKGFITTGAALGPQLLVRALIAGIVARFLSLPVALAAGLALGVVEQVTLWNYPTGSEVELVLFVLLLGALLLQRQEGGRLGERGSWLAVAADKPLPDSLRAVWAVRNLGRLAAGGAFVVLLLVALTTSRTAAVMTTVVGFTLVGLSVYVITGLGGQLSLGQFALAGIGAVASYRITLQGVDFAWGFLGAAVAAGVVSVLVGLPALRVKGLLLTVSTLGFAVMCEVWLFQQTWAFGPGVDPGRPVYGDLVLDGAKGYYLFTLPVLVLGVWLTWNVRRGAVGRALVALRDNEDGARAFTVETTRLKLQAFALAGVLAGLGGAVYAHGFAQVSAAQFPAAASITAVALAVIGGVGLLGGALLGALYLVALPSLVDLGAAALAASTAGWLLLILYFPGGLAQVVQPLRDRLVDALARRAGLDPAAERAAVTTAPDVEVRPLQVRPPGSHGRRPGLDVALRVEGLSRSFGGVQAVQDVSFEVAQGEVLGVIGANGAGKTTMFELVSGFTRPDAGRVLFAGVDVTQASPQERARLGLVRSFQDARLFPTMTVLDVVRLSLVRVDPPATLASLAGTRGALRAERRRDERAREVVELMGLTRYRDATIGTLSTGTRRITELACLVALEPSMLLLDEPCSGIAQRETEALGELILGLRRHLDASVVVIEHDIPMVTRVSDRLLAMETGRVIAWGEPQQVVTDPAVVASYLGGDVRAIERSGRTVVPAQHVPGRCGAPTRSGSPCSRAAGTAGRCAQHAAARVG